MTTEPIVETVSGKVRGAEGPSGTLAFRGIPYGANTGGANRWQRAKAPAPWVSISVSERHRYCG